MMWRDALAAGTTVTTPSFSLGLTAVFVIGLILGVMIRGKF